jgi:hypothetical protein
MDKKSATTLWNSLANEMVSDNASNETPFGKVLLSHGVPTWVYPGDSSVQERHAAASFLRKWADALESL